MFDITVNTIEFYETGKNAFVLSQITKYMYLSVSVPGTHTALTQPCAYIARRLYGVACCVCSSDGRIKFDKTSIYSVYIYMYM